MPVGHVEETGGHGILEWLVNIQVESEKIETGVGMGLDFGMRGKVVWRRQTRQIEDFQLTHT